MKIRKMIPLILLICTLSAILFVSTSRAQNYQQVTTITGASDKTTNYFIIPSSEWRISWSYTPSSSGGTYAVFSVFTYPKGETAIFIDSLMKMGTTETSGVTYVHQGNKEYYMKIGAANIDSYTITIEAVQAPTPSPTQAPTPSPTVPEFPVNITVIILLAAATAVSLLILKKRSSTTLSSFQG